MPEGVRSMRDTRNAPSQHSLHSVLMSTPGASIIGDIRQTQLQTTDSVISLIVTGALFLVNSGYSSQFC